jgi:tetratricopeptide (TPR) repeat protein
MPETSSGGSSKALVHEGWDHLKAWRPLAAWASWQRALRLEGGSPAATQAIATLESAADLPAAARAAYRLRTPSDAARRAAWDERLQGKIAGLASAGTGEGNGHGGFGNADLAAMADAFGRLAMEGPPDPAAWYNRALCLAWLGSNREAVSGLERVVELEAGPTPDRAVEAWTLAEVLRQGGGAPDLADDLRFACTIDWDPADTAALLAEFPEIQRVPTPRAPGVPAGLAPDVEVLEWLDQRTPEAATGGADRPATAAALPIVLASVIVDPSSRTLRLSSPRVETLQQAEESLFSRLGIGGGPERGGGAASIRREAAPLPLPFLDADVWTVRIPAGLEPSRTEELQRDWVEHYYEDVWIHRPRQGLGGRSPLAAAEAARRGDAVGRAKLAAAVAFREQLGRRLTAQRLYQGYPFDRLRRRLGLPPNEPDAVDSDDLSCAAPWELAALDPATLDDRRLADAVASASGLLDDGITAPLGAELLRRSLPIAGAHLIGVVAPLVRRASHSGDPNAAIDWIERARTRADARTAERLDVWRAEILARAGRPDEAVRVYRGLVGPDAKGASMALDGALTLIDNRHLGEARSLLHAARDLARANGLRWTVRRAQELLSEPG